jgi:predicted anti-sigma-YlaC factor YlaD
MTSTSAWECADTRQALGVYVLGAIDPAERALVDAHVAGCSDCRDELAGLAGLPALLSRVGADEISRISREDTEWPPEDDELRGDFADSLVSLTAARRRRNRRWQVLAAAAALVIAAGGAAASYQLVNGSPTGARAEPAPPANWQTARTTSAMNGIDATIKYSKLSWGMAYDVQISGIPAGTTCQLWVTNAQGVHLLAAGWTVSSRDPDPWYPGSSWVPAGQVKGMDVTAGNQELATFTTG